MSGNLALNLPLPGPERVAQPAPYIELAPTRSQRRARPKTAYALIIVAGLGAVLLSQLLLSIALADGAYQIAALQTQQKELNREQQMATEALDVLSSPQSLAARAESLGMVGAGGSAYLNLSTGAVLGVPSAAAVSAFSVLDSNGNPVIPNSLIESVPNMGAVAADADVGLAVSGESGATGGIDSVASYPDGIPAPVTR